MTVTFFIPGPPQGKGRPRFSTQHGRTITRTPEQTVLYENLVKMEYQQQCPGIRFPDDAMLDVRVYAFYAIPSSVSKMKRKAMLEKKIWPTKKPDVDNVFKAVCDSLNGIAYRDDAQVVDGMVRKFYAEHQRVVVTIKEI